MLCGLQRPIKNYDPSVYENELYLITKKSKGYRRGFEDNSEPILGDKLYTPIIKSRILSILRAFIGKGIISAQELESIIPKKEDSNSIFKKAIEGIIYNALTGNLNENNQRFFESKITELNDQLLDLSDDYDNLLVDSILSKREYEKKLSDQDIENYRKNLINYVLFHFMKYCDALIDGYYPTDFKVILRSLDYDSMVLLMILYQGLNIVEWDNLMKILVGTPNIQVFLHLISFWKSSEIGMEYNKSLLFTLLTNFRIMKFSS
jgi:hypothetical protein